VLWNQSELLWKRGCNGIDCLSCWCDEQPWSCSLFLSRSDQGPLSRRGTQTERSSQCRNRPPYSIWVSGQLAPLLVCRHPDWANQKCVRCTAGRRSSGLGVSKIHFPAVSALSARIVPWCSLEWVLLSQRVHSCGGVRLWLCHSALMPGICTLPWWRFYLTLSARRRR